MLEWVAVVVSTQLAMELIRKKVPLQDWGFHFLSANFFLYILCPAFAYK